MPLFLGGSIEPNVMFTLDDSGSTHWEMMPEGLKYAYFLFPRPDHIYNSQSFFGDYTSFVPSFGQTDNIYDKWMRSSAINRIYYNPAITYRPWSNGDGSLMAASFPSCAYHNPVKTSIGCRNLTANNSERAYWLTYNGTLADLENIGVPRTSDADNETRSFWPAFYYTFTGDLSSAASKESAANYTRVEIKSANAPFTGSADRSDCADAPSCTYDEEIQNFANWYTYYRSRVLLARAGVGRAFAEQGTGLRVGFAAINKGSATVDSVNSPGAVVKGVRKFSGSDRSAFFDSLYNYEIPTSGTPLRRALDNVGQYFSRTDNRGPWGETPGTNSNSAHIACRQSYNILMTDGYWNGAAAPTSGAADADNVSGPSITGPDNLTYQYTPANPYQGLNADNSQQNDTLADVAMYYWNRDLRTDLDNLVPPNPADEAFWQHLVNFAVGLGVMGTLDPDTDLPALTNGTKTWPAPSSDAGRVNIDDLWHATVNSRGGFFSASDPEAFANQLSASLKQIVGQGAGSVAAIATNSAELNANTFIFQTWFLGQDWRGELLGFKVDENTGAIIDANPSTSGLDPTWEAAKLLDTKSALAHNRRNIFTHEAADSDADGEVGVDFLWDGTHTPPASLQTLLKNGDSDTIGERRLGFIRGNQNYEIGNDPAGTFRKRVSVLGDIVNSDPFFVGQQDYGFNVLPGTEGSSYISYRASSAYKDRPGVVYVGVNDGMLHAFREDTGYELFAYIPEAVLPNLWELSDPNYSHRFFVDGPSSGKDAYINGNWKSVLLGTTGAGGKAVFALNVTDPENFIKADIMWEFSTDDDDADADGIADGDLGYTIGQPTVARMANGAWVAIFGNGYYSTNNRAALFIVDIASGTLIRKIDTGVGDSSTPNGLATPILVDYNDDKIADRAYAGDLHGNMWAFDLSHASDTTQWEVDYQASGSPAPLFTAMDEDSNTQAITSKPEVTNHPSGGVMVFFGTGKYFDSGDGAVIRKNAFYGIWDDFNATTPGPISGGRSSLLQQTITHETFTDSSGNSWLSDDVNLTANPFTWDLRVTTENSISWGTHRGWFIDLKSPLAMRGWEGERVVSTPLLRDGRVIFSTMIPTLDPCEYGGTSWLMELSSVDGSRLSVSPFDLNADGAFNDSDYVTIVITDPNGNPMAVKVPTSGKLLKTGSELIDFIPPWTPVEPLDFQSPSVEVITPADGSSLSTPDVLVTGTATDCGKGDNGIASVTVNGMSTIGGSAAACETAHWSLPLSLGEGTNSFTVTATDASPAGNQTHRNLTLVYVPLIADDNGNGLPDSWEAANGVTDPGGHSDTDNINDGDEYRAGTDPNDPLSRPEGAKGINYVLLRDHFDDGQYDDRWYLSLLDPYTDYLMNEAGSDLTTSIQRPATGCKGLRFQHFSTVDAVNAVYHAVLRLDGRGTTALGLLRDTDPDNRIEITLDNNLPPHLTLTSLDDGLPGEISVPLPDDDYRGEALDLRITKAGTVYRIYLNNIPVGVFSNNGLGNLDLRPYVELSGCAADSEDSSARIDLIEILLDRDADGRADTYEDANADGVVNFGESDPLNPDSDGDTAPDGADNCLLVENGDQLDSDLDGFGDACDPDAKPLRPILLEDFSGETLHAARFDAAESIRSVTDVPGRLLLGVSASSPFRTIKRTTLDLSDISALSLQAEIEVTQATLGNDQTQMGLAGLGGIYYNTRSASTDYTGEVYARVVIGNRGSGLEAWWEIWESLDKRFGLADGHWGTIIPPGMLSTGSKNTAFIRYDGGSGFTFIVNGISSGSVAGPARLAAPSWPSRSLETQVRFGFDNAGGGLMNELPDDGTPAAFQALFDDLFANGVLIEQFAGAGLDSARWMDGQIRQVVEEGRLSLRLSGGNTHSRIALRDASVNYLSARVRLLNDTMLPLGSRGRVGLDGVWYNTLYDSFSGESHNGMEGDLFAMIALERDNDGTLKAIASGERSDDPTWSSWTQMFEHQFSTPVSPDTEYELSIELRGTDLLFSFAGEPYTYPAATPVYAPSPFNLFKSVHAIVEGGPGVLALTVDDIYTANGFPLEIADDNGNGLPDIWESENGVTDPADHSDADDAPDGQEFLAGTDPQSDLSKPEDSGAVLLRDHFNDQRYYDRWYRAVLDSGTYYQASELETELQLTMQQPESGCRVLRVAHFSAIEETNLVYQASVRLNGSGVTHIGLIDNPRNHIGVKFNNDAAPYASLLSRDADVITELPGTGTHPYTGSPVKLRITKTTSEYIATINGIELGRVTNNGLGAVPNRPFIGFESCLEDAGSLDARIDLVEILADQDGDGIADLADNCAAIANFGQTDSGGVNSSVPDGIGDACQCGDQNGDGKVTNTDAVLIQRHILGLSSPFNADLCDVNGDGSCTNTDAVIIKRAVLGLPPGVGQGCAAALRSTPASRSCCTHRLAGSLTRSAAR